MVKHSKRAHGRRWPARLLLAGVLTTMAAFSGLGSPALAAPVSEVGISRVSASPQQSGNTFTYQVAYQCSDVDGETCDDGVITIPLGDAAGFGIDVTSASGLAQSWEVVGDNLVIQLPDSVDAGTSGTIQVTVVPPNHTTPDGTEWELLPTVSGSNFNDASASEPADGKATADIRPTITKTRNKAFREPGDEIIWTVRVACQQPGAGNLLVGTMTVVDELDDDFVYTGSSGGGVYDGTSSPRTVTWTYAEDELPTSCSTPGESGHIEQTVTGTVAANHAFGETLPNHADATATSFDNSKTKTVGADASVTIVSEENPPGPTSINKYGHGQLAGPGTVDVGPGRNNKFQSTYPGRWSSLRGGTDMTAGSGWINDPATSAFYTEISNTDGYANEVRDAMPCLDNLQAGTSTYRSQLGSTCERPAFHPTTVQVEGYRPGHLYPPASFAPRAVLTDGSSVDLVRAATATNIWNVPAANIGDVAEIVLPRYELDASYQLIWIEGYADSTLADGDILQNVIDVDQYYKNTKVGDLSDDGAIYILDKPQIGVVKSFGAPGGGPDGSTMVNLGGATLFAPGEPTEDFVITDLLPLSMKWSGDPSIAAVLQKSSMAGSANQNLDLTPELIDNFQGTGRQLVRFTITVDQLLNFDSSLAGGGRFKINGLNFPVTTPADPGIYTNTVAGYYDSTSLDVVCLQNDAGMTQISTDPYDQNDNGSTTDRHCEAVASVTIASKNIGPDFKVIKTVQGSSDAAPRTWPAHGTVDEAGGTVEFGLEFKNVAATPLNGAVLYDLLPRVGDTAVSGSLAGQPRHSAFTPLLTNVDALPAGVAIEYSTEINPCRDEVYANSANPTCVDDWTSTAPADLADVTALRFRSSETFQAGQGFRVTYDMTTPSIDAGQFAWNSVAARASNANSGSPMLASEPPKVGLTADSTVAPPVIGKTVDQATAVPGDLLTYTVTVSNSGLTTMADIDLVDTLPAGVVFESATGGGTHADGIIRWDDLSLTSGQTLTFTVKARVQAGASGTLLNKAEIPDWATTVESNNPCTDDPEGACAETEVPGQQLTVEKIVNGDAANHAEGPYTVAVDCRLNGASLSGFPQDVEFSGSEESDPIAVPIGVECTAVETEDGGATSATVSPSDGIEITSSTTAEFKLTVTNTFDAGSLVLNKQLAGVGAGDFGDGPFEFSVVCTFEGREVHDSTIELERSADETTLTSDPITGLPIGASCTVTETDSGTADSTPAPATVVIAKSPTSTPVDTVYAELTNEFSAGDISVAKVLDGAGSDAAAVQDTEFTVMVTCQIESVDGAGDPVIGTVFSGPVVIKGGETVKVTAAGEPVLLPVGTHCFAEETVTGGADEVEVSHESFDDAVIVTAGEPDDVQSLTIDVTNAFEEKSFTVTKVVEGGAAQHAAGPYVIAVDCRIDGDSVTGFPKDVTLTAAGISDPVVAPIGSTCTAAETEDGGATSVVVSPVEGVDIVAGSTVVPTIAVTNIFDAGKLSINKDITGVGGKKFGKGPFTFDIVCSFEGREIGRRSVELRRSSDDQTTLTLDPIGGLPIGGTCTVTETGKGGADDLPAPVTVTIAKDPTSTPVDTVFAHLTNKFSAGKVQVEKKLAGAAKDAKIVRKQVFTVAVVCQLETLDQAGNTVRGTVFNGDVKLRGGQIVTAKNSAGEPVMLPAGTRCFADETVDRGADKVTVSHPTFEKGAQITTGKPDALQTVSITVTNRFDADNGLVLSDDEEAGNGDDSDGWLPSAGGPQLILLLAGLSLAVAGYIVIALGRRSKETHVA